MGSISDKNNKLAGFEIFLEYNENVVAEGTLKTTDTENWQVYYTDYSIGDSNGIRVVGVYGGDSTLLDGNRELFTVQFRAAMYGTATFSVNTTLSKLVEKDEDTIPFTASTAQTKIWKYGDVNKDSNVDIKDLVRLQKILLNEESETITADVNDDGEVNIADLVELIEYLLSTEVIV